MKKLIWTLAASIFVLAVPSKGGAQEAVAPVDPSGMYDFVAVLGIEARTGTLEVTQTADGWDGEVWLEGEGDPALIESGTVTGNHVVLNAVVGPNPITFELDFTDDRFTGVVNAGGDVITMEGTKRAE